MKVELISITKPVKKEIEHFSPEEVLSYVARVSNPSNQMNSETSSKLLGYCIKHAHWSVFEHVNMTVEIQTSRAIAAQILRHRSFVFQEFCMAGDTQVYFDLPSAVKNNKKHLYKIKLEDIYRKWHSVDALGNPIRDRIKNMNVRCFDEKTKKLTHAKIKDVFSTGIKDIYEIELSNGRKIKSTKEHKVLTKNGFQSLEDCIGLNRNKDKAYITNNTLIGCNGMPVHQDYDWMKLRKQESINNKKGLSYIADEAGVSYHTIRKWLKNLNLKFTKKEVSEFTEAWNKGKSGYKLKPRTKEQRERMRSITSRGKDHHAYLGGAGSERKSICNFFNPIRKEIYSKFNFKCQLCHEDFGGRRIELHHIKEVSVYPELAKDIENVIPVHRDCHMSYHGKTPLFKNLINRKSQKTASWASVKSVKYLGKMETYDLEINHHSHNYVADGVIVHNSQRYAEAVDVEKYPARRQDNKNRQNSIDDMDEDVKKWFQFAQDDIASVSMNLYKQALAKGVAKEQARFLLPLSTSTTLYMTGNVRNWIHYVELRTKNGTQLEHKEIADAIKTIFTEQFPAISQALNWV
jgi:thymidylate synthase (FAD)